MRTNFLKWICLAILITGIASRAYCQQSADDALFTRVTADGGTVSVRPLHPAGYLITTEKDGASTLLGWSESGSFPEDPSHPLNTWLLPHYATSTPHPHRTKSSMSTDEEVAPILTARWGQGDSWNRFCPADLSGQKALVGCASVAMAQIMHYWRWPDNGTGTVSYIPPRNPEYGRQAVNFDTVYYDWSHMEDRVPTDASALLLYHAGVASYMNYGPDESATSVDGYAYPALRDHFLYQPGMVFREEESYNYSGWIIMLKQELINGRPVLYTGTSPDGKSSHAFNLDGFRGDYYFHFNWGWSGAGDGWYTLPEMGGGSADYSSGQAAIFGMQPATKALHDRPTLLEVMPGDGFVQLFWQRPVSSDFSHFTVYRDGTPIELTPGLTCRDEGLVNGTSYSYAVSANYEGQEPGESDITPEIVTIPWAAMTPGYVQAFESGTSGWQMMGTEGGFMVGLAADLGFENITGRIAAIRSQGLPEGIPAKDYLTSPLISPSDYTHLAISFDYVFKQNRDQDHLFLMYRDFLTGLWQPVARLDSTGDWNSWTNFHVYLPKPASQAPIQIAFYYNDFYGNGYGAAIDNVRIYEVPETCTPAFSADKLDLCESQLVTFTDESAGPAEIWQWDFGAGAEPRYASTRGPHQVMYTQPGHPDVRLSLNRLDHLVKNEYIRVRNQPVSGFEWRRSSMTIQYTSVATHAEPLLWLFGDGTSSTETNPAHTYWNKFLFEVKLIAYNGNCPPDTAIREVDLRPGTGIGDNEVSDDLSLWPNPTTGKITLLWNIPPADCVRISVLSTRGTVLARYENASSRFFEIDLSELPEGIYILRILSGTTIRTERIVKT